MKKFFINGYNQKTMQSKLFATTEEDKAIAIVDSEVASGLKYVSVMCLSTEEPMQGWEHKGQTCVDDKWYDVYLLLIKETYNA